MKPLVCTMLLLPNLAFALECTFTTECYENEACQETAYELTLTRSDDYQSAEVESVTGTFKTQAYNFQGMSSYAGFTDNTLHLISHSANGDARYAVHTGDQNGVSMITYLGTCQ